MPVRFFSLIRAALFAVLLAPLVPAVAEASTPPHWGWVTARKPTTASYTPAAKDQGNSSGGTNTVARSTAGRYVITFGGLDATNCSGNGCLGTALATALSTLQRSCAVSESGPLLPLGDTFT